MKVKLLVFLLDSYDLQYVNNPSRMPNLFRMGQPYNIQTDHELPAISVKAWYAFYTGVYKDIRKGFWKEVRNKKLGFWNEFTEWKTGLLGLPMGEGMIPINGIAFSLETYRTNYGGFSPKDYLILYPPDLNKLLHDVDCLRIAREFHKHKEFELNKHEIYKKIINYIKELDMLILFYQMDRFCHKLAGPPLRDIYSWMDTLIGEILDIVQADNIIAFSDHGAHHNPMSMFVSKLQFDYPKLKHYKEIVPLIKHIYRKYTQ